MVVFNSSVKAQSQKPNIIFILGDDVGYKSLTCDGGNLYSTPNIDTLAQNGMRFTECHASPLCSPSRFMFLTGKYNFRNFTRGGVMDTAQRTIGNMFRSAGYKTACFGKWQLSGGDMSVNALGFDQYTLYDVLDPENIGSRYKNPHLYTHGNFLPDSMVINKFGPDIIADSLYKFMEDNKSNPFFIYYPMTLVHQPYSPTPNDTSAFASWNPNAITSEGDTLYFNSMMKYMDKEIGQLVNKIKSLGIEKNTVIIFCGDNGTPHNVSDYIDDDNPVSGGKKSAAEAGIHVPLIVYWPGVINPATTNNDLIDFPDFLPALAEIGNITIPTTYGTLDGVSFAPRLTGQAGKPREWSFCYYDPQPEALEKKPAQAVKRWAQTTNYKLYDTSSLNTGLLFYNIVSDPTEKKPISDSLLTPDEILIKQQLLDAINNYVVQGFAVLSNPVVSDITHSSFLIKDTILINGGSSVTASGVVWGTSPNPVIPSSHTTSSVCIGASSNAVTGLTANTLYYVRAYATNYAGTVYSDQISFKTLLSVPIANTANSIDSTGFIAHWNTVAEATTYKLDVSTLSTFAVVKPLKLSEEFNNGIILPAGWSTSNDIVVNNSFFGKSAPSVEFTASKAQIVTNPLYGTATKIKFWMKGINTDTSSWLLIEGFNGTTWLTIQKIKNLSHSGMTKTFSSSSTHPLPANISQFRFTFKKSSGTLVIDDVTIYYNSSTPSFVPGYNNLNVKDTSRLITNLKAGMNYYYRVRAANNNNTSINSNVINTTICKAASIINISKINLNCAGSANGSITLTITGGIAPLAYIWSGPNDFTSTIKDISNLEAGLYNLKITSNGGCTIDTSIMISEPSAIQATAAAEPIVCSGNTTTLTVSASGGTGNYHYTLFDGTNTVGPHDDNHFTVSAGNYTVIVEDDNHCSFTTENFFVEDGSDSCNGFTSVQSNKQRQAQLRKQTEKNNQFEVSIFPNPAINEFNFSIRTNNSKPVYIFITDAYGKKVYEFLVNDNNKHTFGKNFAAGIYFVQAQQGNTKRTMKLVKVD